MATAKITLVGLENFADLQGDTMFSLFELPDGIDKDTVIFNILQEGGDFEVLYPDLDYMRNAIYFWCKKWERTFTKWYNALQIEYDPLNNYDRHEEWTENETGENANESSSSGTDNNTNNLKVAAYESDTLHEKEQVTDTGTSTTQAEGSGNYSTENLKKGRAYGNIGVTTSQQMLESELEIAEWNLVQHITDIFLSEFCLGVYY